MPKRKRKAKSVKLKVITASDYKNSLAKVKSALDEYDASPAKLIEWHENIVPIINALVRCVGSTRKSVNKGSDYSLATSVSVASSQIPKLKINFKALRKAQLTYAKRVKTLSSLADDGITQYLPTE